MPQYLAPGVYVEEVSTGNRPIAAVGTSTAAFFGFCPNSEAPRTPTLLTNYAEFKRSFIGESEDSSDLIRAVFGFFSNGGSKLFVINLGPQSRALNSDDLALIAAQDGISIVAAPGITDQSSIEALVSDCEHRRDRFAILDAAKSFGSVTDLTDAQSSGGLRPRTAERGVAAIYTPWLQIMDPVTKARVDAAPSGHMAGLYATTDATRGVHKAPANISIRGTLQLNYNFTSGEHEVLNDANVNAIRTFQDGIRVWGARTLSDPGSEYKYIPVRRLTTMISQSLERGLQWVVFEPNDETLWKSIRRDVGAFMHTLWREGALMGTTPEQAYFVKCDAETTTQADIDLGRVNVLIGFAPVKPAEFVVIQIGQMASGSVSDEA